MKSKLLAITVSILLISLAYMEGYSVKANPNVYASMPKLQITSPVENVTYNTSPVSFAVKGQVMQNQLVNQPVPYFSCNLDGMNFIVNAAYEGNTSDGWVVFSGKIALSDLANGRHTVSVSQISNSQIARALNPVSVSFNVANSNSAINPAPVAPEFTVKFGGSIPTKMDGFTWPCANFTIKNQPLPTYTQDGLKINLYYYIRWKEHSDTSWIHYTIPVNESDSDYTIYSYNVHHGEGPNEPHASGQVDFQVAARIASFTTNNVFVGQTSDWSNTQTITIPQTSPTPTPTIPEFSSLAIQFSLITMGAFAGLLVYFKKRKR